MDDNKFKVLKYYYDNGAVDLNVLADHFTYDLSQQQFRDTLNYLIGKKYLSNIYSNDVVYELSDLGRQTVINTIEKDKINNNRQVLRENLEFENLNLQNDSIKHQNSIRNKQEKINLLTIENLNLQNRQLKRYILYAIIGFIFGLIATNISVIYQTVKELVTK